MDDDLPKIGLARNSAVDLECLTNVIMLVSFDSDRFSFIYKLPSRDIWARINLRRVIFGRICGDTWNDKKISASIFQEAFTSPQISFLYFDGIMSCHELCKAVGK